MDGSTRGTARRIIDGSRRFGRDYGCARSLDISLAVNLERQKFEESSSRADYRDGRRIVKPFCEQHLRKRPQRESLRREFVSGSFYGGSEVTPLTGLPKSRARECSAFSLRSPSSPIKRGENAKDSRSRDECGDSLLRHLRHGRASCRSHFVRIGRRYRAKLSLSKESATPRLTAAPN
jgi:hypothetical protein